MAKATFYFTADDGRDPIVFTKEPYMKNVLHRVLVVLREPAVRPFEVWAIRLAVAFVAAQLGIDAAHLVQHP